jgi:HEAT repeat protein
MIQNTTTIESIQPLISLLADKDGMARRKARESLVAIGGAAVSALCGTLQHDKANWARWEAAKALGAIGNAQAIPALVEALEDRDTDVTWVAADALEKFGKAAWPELMRALVERGSESLALRQGAHHVLRAQQAAGFDDLLAALRKSLESQSAPENTIRAADAILAQMGEAAG